MIRLILSLFMMYEIDLYDMVHMDVSNCGLSICLEWYR